MQLIHRVVNYQGDPTFTLVPLGDEHLGTMHCDRALFRKDIKKIDDDPHAIWINMGDACESIVLSDPRFEVNEIAPEFRHRLQDIAVAQRDAFIEDVTCIKDKCIGLLEGNHEFENKRRHYVDITLDSCRALDVPYLGDAALIRLTFRKVDDEGKQIRSHNVVIYAEHGHGGGRKTGGKINSLEDVMSSFDADIYLRGHVHTKLITKQPRISMTAQGKPKMACKTRICALTGTYYRTFEENTSSYGQRKGYAPTELGCVSIRIKPSTGEMEGIS